MQVARWIAVGTTVGALAWPVTAATPLLPIPVLVCQQSIGTASLRYVTRTLKAERRCRDAEAAGAVCDEVRRTDDVADARTKLGKTIVARCASIDLEELGFPGACDDVDGAPFTAAELVACLVATHDARVGAAMARAHPAPAAPLAGRDLACRRGVGLAAEQFLARRLRARQSCRNDQLSGAVAAAVDCRAEPPPAGAGSGHAATDRRLVTAADTLAKRLARSCADTELTMIGFPGGCDDLDGPPFTLVDLETCLHAGHALAADELMAIEYPAS